MDDKEFAIRSFFYSRETRTKVIQLRQAYKDVMELRGARLQEVTILALRAEIRRGNVKPREHIMKKLNGLYKQTIEYGSY